MATAVIENVNKMSKYGLRRKPTYEEITNLISENEKLTGTLPNRDATFSEIHQEAVILMVAMLWSNYGKNKVDYC